VQSYFLSDDVVNAYLNDLATRLKELPVPQQPLMWCPLGPSGLILAKQLLKIAEPPEAIFPIVWKRGITEASFSEPEASDRVRGSPVLILDTAIHSGATLAAAIRLSQASGCSSIISFALVVRCNAVIIPNFFSLLINDTDRACLPNETLPNQRLAPEGVFRHPTKDDLSHPMINSGVEFIDKSSWADHLYDMKVDPCRRVYLVENHGRPQGYISFYIQAQILRIDEVAVDKESRGRRFGTFLIRWAENLARHRGCRESTLWAIDNRVTYYERLDYKLTGDILSLGKDGVFKKMSKPILYNVLVPSA
jgi:GNAT superfamily N-acetyltransferase